MALGGAYLCWPLHMACRTAAAAATLFGLVDAVDVQQAAQSSFGVQSFVAREEGVGFETTHRENLGEQGEEDAPMTT